MATLVYRENWGSGLPAARHKGGFNALCWDGHAEWYPPNNSVNWGWTNWWWAY